VSACWGLFWSVFASRRVLRGTASGKWCGQPHCGIVPLLMVGAMVWMMDSARSGHLAISAGVAGVPVTLLDWAEEIADGTRVGERLIGGAQTMMDTMLGRQP